MKKLITISLFTLLTSTVYADLGINFPVITDSNAEHSAKQEASNLGITQIYDAPTQAPTGEFYVPITYNRPGDPAAGQQDPNSPVNTTDIDYVPLTQLKGSAGTQGTAGQTGAQGVKGDTGAKGDKGDPGKDGKDANLSTQMEMEGVIRIYDGKRFVVEAFDNYSLRDNHNNAFGGRITFKIGKSYDTRRTEALEKRLKLLEAALDRLSD